jgi:hypothetical protein
LTVRFSVSTGIKEPISKKSGNQGLLLKNCMKIKELRV